MTCAADICEQQIFQLLYSMSDIVRMPFKLAIITSTIYKHMKYMPKKSFDGSVMSNYLILMAQPVKNYYV